MRLFTSFLTLALAALTLLQAGAASYQLQSKPTIAASYLPQAPALPAAAPTLNVFPNPGRGQVSVQLTAPQGQEYKFRLSNVLGREVRLLALRPELAAEGLPLDVSSLPAGLYFYSLLVNDKVVSTNRLTLQ